MSNVTNAQATLKKRLFCPRPVLELSGSQSVGTERLQDVVQEVDPKIETPETVRSSHSGFIIQWASVVNRLREEHTHRMFCFSRPKLHQLG